MPIRFFVVACLVFGATACDERLPAGPVAQSPAPATPTVPATPQQTGVVRDSSGNPIAGAEITFWPAIDKQFTNEAGLFTLPREYFELVYAHKSGYEPSVVEDAPIIALTLHDIITISVGQSVRVTIRPDDSLGGYGLRYRIRRIRLVTTEPVNVQVQVSADDSSLVDFWIQDNCGDLCPHWVGLTRLTLPGSRELQMFIAVPSGMAVSRTFTVKTSVVQS